MPMYRVHLHQTVCEEAFIDVEAPSALAAKKQAMLCAGSGDVEWQFVEAISDAVHISTTKTKE